MIYSRFSVWMILLLLSALAPLAQASESVDPETAIRRLVRANAEKDLPTLSRMMAHDADIISYGVEDDTVASRSPRRVKSSVVIVG